MSQEYIFEICNVISAVKTIMEYLKASGNKAREANRSFPFEIENEKQYFNKKGRMRPNRSGKMLKFI